MLTLIFFFAAVLTMLVWMSEALLLFQSANLDHANMTLHALRPSFTVEEPWQQRKEGNSIEDYSPMGAKMYPIHHIKCKCVLKSGK